MVQCPVASSNYRHKRREMRLAFHLMLLLGHGCCRQFPDQDEKQFIMTEFGHLRFLFPATLVHFMTMTVVLNIVVWYDKQT